MNFSLLTDLEASSQLPANQNTSSQTDCHTHSNGDEWIPIPDGRGQGEGNLLELLYWFPLVLGLAVRNKSKLLNIYIFSLSLDQDS